MLAHVEPLASEGEFPQGEMSTFAASLFQVHYKNPTSQDVLYLIKEISCQMMTSHHYEVFCYSL